MNNKIVYFGLGLIVCLPGCGRIIDWGKSNFYQGTNLEDNHKQVEPYLRSTTIYDELSTKARFEVLWLSDEVRTAFANLHSFRLGKDEDKQTAFLRRQLEENSHYVSFYVLSTYGVPLGDPDAKWCIFLGIDGTHYQPVSIKPIELPYEYQLFFGDLWNRFKVPYLVRFSAVDLNNNPIITDETAKIHLFFRSANKQHKFMWQLKDTPPIERPFVIRHKKVKNKKQTPSRVPRKRKRK